MEDALKALKDCVWCVKLLRVDGFWFWSMTTRSLTGLSDGTGLSIKKLEGRNYNTKTTALKNLNKFIEINALNVKGLDNL